MPRHTSSNTDELQVRHHKGDVASYRSFIAACNGSLLVCALESGFRIVRYRMLPGPHLENIDSGRREKLSDVNASYGGSKSRLRVTMYIINDTRAG